MEDYKIDNNKKNIRRLSIETLYSIWACIPWDKVDGKRAYGIWDEFASKIKASAMTTNSYERFIEKLCRKLEIRSLRGNTVNKISQQDEEFKRAILKLMREETVQLVLELRLNNETRKEMEQSIREQKIIDRELDEMNRQVMFYEKGAKLNYD